mmetsp:Transcript_37319/g.96490  ORF Transcript_37319/g.96490 Transcript_37319/m.96490 type:complete len:193 (-) Transcript_37319:2735-3313(-)
MADARYCCVVFDELLLALGKGMEQREWNVPMKQSPLFVTLNKLHGFEYHLRGCIGTFSPQPLLEGLKRYALASAFEDSRFEPISKSEVPLLQVSVSLLTDFEDVDDPFNWELDTHGVTIHFQCDDKSYSATYLPGVAVDAGWTKQETLDSLIRKSGYRGARIKWANLSVTRYKSSKATLNYEEYLKLREQVE